MDGDFLFAHESEEGTLHQGAADGLGGPRQDSIELFDVIAATDAHKLKHGLIVLEAENGLVAWDLLAFTQATLQGGKARGREGGRTIVRHDQVDLRLLDCTLAEIGSNEATSVSRQGGLGPLVEALALGRHPSRHEVQHSLQEMGQCVWDGTFLDHESVERVILYPAVDDPVYSRADGVVRRRELSADSVDDLVRVVSTTNPVSTGNYPGSRGGERSVFGDSRSRSEDICEERKQLTRTQEYHRFRSCSGRPYHSSSGPSPCCGGESPWCRSILHRGRRPPWRTPTSDRRAGWP